MNENSIKLEDNADVKIPAIIYETNTDIKEELDDIITDIKTETIYDVSFTNEICAEATSVNMSKVDDVSYGNTDNTGVMCNILPVDKNIACKCTKYEGLYMKTLAIDLNHYDHERTEA